MSTPHSVPFQDGGQVRSAWGSPRNIRSNRECPRFESGCGEHVRDPKHRNATSNRREVSERRVPVQTDMWTRTGGEFQIPAKDRRPLVNRQILEKHGFTRPAPEHSPAPGRPNNAKPVRPLAEHCDEVALTVPVGDHRSEEHTS